MKEIVKQPMDTVKDEILLKNGCCFSQQQFLGSNGAEPLANEEVSGTVSQVYAAMDEFSKKRGIEFVRWKYGLGYLPKLNPNNDVPEWGWHRQENQIIWSKWISDDELYKLFEEKS